MPFRIVKVDGGFKVVDDRGRMYSRHPLTRYKARQQQKALFASEARGGIYNGSGYQVIDGHILLEGAGFFSDVWKVAKRITRAATAPIRAVVQRVGDVSRGIRFGYPPNVRSVIGDYGVGVVANIIIRREPIQSFVDKALNVISFGKWNKAKDELNYDKLYHLSMVVSLTMPDGLERAVMMEKNEVINITPNFSMSPKMDFVRVPVSQQLTLKEMLDNTQGFMGADYFTYDPFKNNCQRFIDSVLTANSLNTPNAHAFIVQPVEELLKKLPGYTGKVARAITDVAAVADVALKGRSMYANKKRGGAATREWFNRQKSLGRLKQYASFEDMVGQQKAAQQQAARNAAETAATEDARRAMLQPGEELVACKVKDDLSLGRNVVSKQRCKELHDARFAKWEAENHPSRAKFFRPLVEGLTKVADMAIDNVPGINTIAKEAYKTFAGTVAEKATRAVLGQGKKGPIKISRKDFLAEHKKLLNVLSNPTPAKLKAEYTDQATELQKVVKGKGCGCGCDGGMKPPASWFNIVKRVAEKAGYNPDDIRKASGDKKLTIKTPDGREVSFGAAGAGDYIIYSLLEREGKVPAGTAEKHRTAYLARAKKNKGNWEKDKFSPNNLAIRILWVD